MRRNQSHLASEEQGEERRGKARKGEESFVPLESQRDASAEAIAQLRAAREKIETHVSDLAESERELLAASDAVWELYRWEPIHDPEVLCRFKRAIAAYRAAKERA